MKLAYKIFLGIFLLGVCIYLLKVNSPCNGKIQLNENQRESIFVILPEFTSLSDIDSLFQHAEFPARIFIGIGTNCIPQQNVRCLREISQSMGNAKARSDIFHQLYYNESYILSLDKNMQFLQMHWDSLLIQNSKTSCIQTYWPSLHLQATSTTFPILQKCINGFPIYKSLEITAKLQQDFEIGLVSPYFMFGKACDMIPIHRINIPYLPLAEDIIILSYFCFAKQIKVMTNQLQFYEERPNMKIVSTNDKQHFQVVAQQVRNLFKPNKVKKNIPITIDFNVDPNVLLSFWACLHFNGNKPLEEAYLGLFGHYSEFDVLCHYPSMLDFQTRKLFYFHKQGKTKHIKTNKKVTMVT